MFWADEAGMMSSSRIIKYSQPGDDVIGLFAFQPIGQTSDSQAETKSMAGFLPMGVFDSSEIVDTLEEQLEQTHGENIPVGVTLSEDEMQKRLSESFERGLTEGKNLAERGLVNVFRSLRAATESVHVLREKALRESEDDLINLTMKVARKVILREVATDRRILTNVVRTAIEALSDRCEITIRLNPDDYILVTTSPDDSLRSELLTERMQLKSDPSILPGSCMIDSEIGTLDASIDGQLEEIFRRLTEERNLAADTGT